MARDFSLVRHILQARVGCAEQPYREAQRAYKTGFQQEGSSRCASFLSATYRVMPIPQDAPCCALHFIARDGTTCSRCAHHIRYIGLYYNREMRYRRDQTPGASFFFTLVTFARQPLFADETNVDRLRAAFARVMRNHPFSIDALVLLPDHLHCIWTLPEADADFALRWNLIKGNFTRSLPDAAKRPRSNERREQRVWEPVGLKEIGCKMS